MIASIQLTTMTCDACGITFAVPDEFYRQYEDHGQSMRCVNPRCRWPSFVPTRSMEDELREERDRAKRANNRADTIERSRNAYKGVLTRTKRRIAAGKCPLCSKDFADLKTHFEGQHPGYAFEDDGQKAVSKTA